MKDDIIKWSREAGFMFCEESYKHRPNCLFYGGYAVDEQLERFAALVRADERKMTYADIIDALNQARDALYMATLPFPIDEVKTQRALEAVEKCVMHLQGNSHDQ
jgi:hypothetical protein